MDSKDYAILEELEKDSRQSTALIARKTGIPRVTVHERMEKLRKSGGIKNFSTVLDYKLLGKPVNAFILVTFNSKSVTQHELAEKISKMPGVSEVCIIAGEWDLLVKVHSESLEKLGELIVDKLRKIDGVEKTVTMPVLSSR